MSAYANRIEYGEAGRLLCDRDLSVPRDFSRPCAPSPPLPRSLVLITFDDHIRPLHLLLSSCSSSPSSIRLHLPIASCLLSHWISLTTRYRVGLTRKTRRKPFELEHRNALRGKAVVTWPCRVSSVSFVPRESVGMARLGLVQGHQDGGQVSLVAGYIDVDKTGFESVAD
jgi:hypothetical protein